MTNKTHTTKTVTEKVAQSAVVDLHAGQDLKHSILIISLVANLVIFTAWIALQITTQYDTQIASLLFTR